MTLAREGDPRQFIGTDVGAGPDQQHSEDALYRGSGFSGRPTGDWAPPRPAELPQPPAPDVTPDPELAAALTPECSACHRKAVQLPNERIWCEQCKTYSRTSYGGSGPVLLGFAGALLLLALMLFYVQGTLDHFLYDVGLNWETCGQITGREIVCGDEHAVRALAAPESLRTGMGFWIP